MSLEDCTAIVTGGSSGIGRAIATRLAEDDANVVVADVRREPKQGKYFQEDVTTPTDEVIQTNFEGDATYIETDVAEEEDIINLIDSTIEQYGQLDVLVNNAGIEIPGDSRGTSLEHWQRVVGVNLTGCFLAAKYAVPHLVESDQGRIVNISSVNAHFGGAGPSYASTKAGVVNLTRDLAVELAPAEVTVNTVLPGVIGTPMQDTLDEETLERQSENTPLPRIGTPRDVANAVRFFAGKEAEWITGAQLLVDGGYMAGGY